MRVKVDGRQIHKIAQRLKIDIRPVLDRMAKEAALTSRLHSEQRLRAGQKLGGGQMKRLAEHFTVPVKAMLGQSSHIGTASGEMLQQVRSPGNIQRIGPAHYAFRTTRQAEQRIDWMTREIKQHASAKQAAFLRGLGQASGGFAGWKVGSTITNPARPFLGVTMSDVKHATKQMLDILLQSWGFR